MALEEGAAVPAEGGLQAGVAVDGAQGLGEFLEVLVEQARVAAQALALEHVALRVGEHGLAHGPGLERHHRQALEVGGHDQQFGRRHGVELVLVVDEAEVVDARVPGDGDDGRADEHQVHAVDERGAVVLEVLEELGAALVLVDAAHVDREAVADAELLAEAAGVRSLGHFRSDTHHHARRLRVAGHALDEGTLLVRVVHERAHAPEDGREEAHAECAVTLGRGDEQGLRRHRAQRVERVGVAEAEEDEEIVVAGVGADVLHEGGACRPLGLEPRQLVAERVDLVKDDARPPSELLRVALARHGEAPHLDAVDGLDALGALVAPRDVVGGAGGEHLHRNVRGQALGDVPRVQFGAAVDVGAVALDDDRDFHC